MLKNDSIKRTKFYIPNYHTFQIKGSIQDKKTDEKKELVLLGAKFSYFGSKSLISGQSWNKLEIRHIGTSVIIKTNLDVSKSSIKFSIWTLTFGIKQIESKGQNNDKLADDRIKRIFSTISISNVSRHVTKIQTG